MKRDGEAGHPGTFAPGRMKTARCFRSKSV